MLRWRYVYLVRSIRRCDVIYNLNIGEFTVISSTLYDTLLTVYFVLIPITFVTLLFIPAPYGRQNRPGWGPQISSRLGWFVMETPAIFIFAWVFFRGQYQTTGAALLFLSLWQIHYINRSIVYPLRQRGQNKTIPVLLCGLAIAFHALNGTVNAHFVAHVHSYDSGWWTDVRLIVGLIVFVVGMAINLHSDAVQRALRAPGESGYMLPRGGMFRFVSSPNYLGEIIEWTGWAIATWSLPGLAFALYTLANLAPRARSNHAWYHAKFSDYPKHRKALIPFVW